MDTCSGRGGIPGAAERLSRFFLSSCSLSSCEALQYVGVSPLPKDVPPFPLAAMI